MRLLNNDNNLKMDEITVLLTYAEASELRDAINDLLRHYGEVTHAHINNEDYSKEITVALYEKTNAKMFNERCRKLINEDI